MRPVILWFRRDLRLADNPALSAALRSNAPVLPVYVLDETRELRALGGASSWWLEKSLRSLSDALEARGSRLILRRGPAATILSDLVAQTQAQGLYFNGIFDPGVQVRDQDLATRLVECGVEVHRFNGAHLIIPDSARTKTDGLFSVFTPFWRTARGQVSAGLHSPAPDRFSPPADWPASENLVHWALHPNRPDWSKGFTDWVPGETDARRRLTDFVDQSLATYSQDRDRPAVSGTSRLSPHLHFGEISPKACWRAAQAAGVRHAAPETQVEKFLAELGWREFNAAIAGRGGDLATDNFNGQFDAFPWRDDPEGFSAWTKGRTGYPLVDAGMRQLWTTGWMHNRVRMVVASFLTKHLLIDWRQGEAWFWDTLVDADHASNAGNWQWVAGSGADAAPYFRIFSPMAQGAKFDPDGLYVRKWVPELRQMPSKLIHAPWLASAGVLAGAALQLGVNYPYPIIDHDVARARALAAYASLKGSRQPTP